MQQAAEAPALLQDGELPAVAQHALLWLVLPLQQVPNQDFQATLQGVLLAFPHTRDLLYEVGDVQGVKLLRLQQRGLRLGPGVKILLVQLGIGAHRRPFPWFHGSFS
jgi:hypothetical protein